MSRKKTSARRGEIGLGDLATALASLDIATEAQLRTLGRCLGLSGLSLASTGTLKAAADQRWRHRRPQPRRPEPRPPGTFPPLPAAPPGPPAEHLETRLERLPDAESGETEELDWQFLAPAVSTKASAPPRKQLFPRRTATGVLSAAIATRRPGRHPDIERLVAHIVQGRPFRALPRLPVPGLSRGVQVLLDRHESMTPYFSDQMDLARAFGEVAGTPRCEVFEFVEDLATALAYTVDDRPKPWRPQPGRPVVVATDFGLGDSLGSAPPIPRRTWRRFAVTLRRLGCPLIAIVPYSPAAWPAWVERHFTALHWDPRTRAENVRALVGPGHAVDL